MSSVVVLVTGPLMEELFSMDFINRSVVIGKNLKCVIISNTVSTGGQEALNVA